MHIGTDEAGKGPVLGSMFAAAVRARPEHLPADVADSKRLSPTRRQALAAEIRESGSVAVVEVPVERIDDQTTDMNELTVQAHANAVSQLTTGDETVFLDAADPNAVRFERRVGQRLTSDPQLQAEHGADESYPVVSAASIVAKVARDAHVSELGPGGVDVGSGYPSDETTRSFLREYVNEHDRLPACARTSWQTATDILARSGQQSLSDFD